LIERPSGGEKALLLHIAKDRLSLAEQAEELQELALSAGAELCCSLPIILRRPDPKYLIGSGTAEALAEAVKASCVELVIVGCEISPAQERNLEQLIQCRVLDRSGLILDIFAQRARSHEGKLQVELAQLQHLSTRLVRGWTHLERQKGGIGLRGPGETQLETDRRLLGTRIKTLMARLARIKVQREQRRQRRQKNDLPTVSLVGYTNAGKSTLFNSISGADVYQADQLFATLDPTIRRIELPAGQAMALADTVGFVRDLPHELVVAFRATLEESRDAALLLHVIDASDPQRAERIDDVKAVLEEIEAHQVPVLRVYNKIDRLEDCAPHVEYDSEGLPIKVWLSAANGQGVDALLELIGDRLFSDVASGWLHLPVAGGRLRARCYSLGEVVDERPAADGSVWLKLRISTRRLGELGGDAERPLSLLDEPVATV